MDYERKPPCLLVFFSAGFCLQGDQVNCQKSFMVSEDFDEIAEETHTTTGNECHKCFPVITFIK